MLLLALFTLTFSSCGDDDDQPNNPVIGTITDIVEGNGDFSTLAAALERTNLAGTLDVPSATFTVFAPTDAAFTASGIDLSAVSDEDLRDILLYHVKAERTPSGDFEDGDFEITSLNTTGAGGSALPIFATNSGGTITLGGKADNSATVATADVEAVNGIIHIIDNVLLPPSVVDRAIRDGRFTTLVAAVTRAGLASALDGAGTFTVFAPTDDAFAASGIDLDAVSDDDLADVLRYHVLGSTVAAGDIAAGFSYGTTINTEGPNDSPLSMIINNDGSTVRINDQADVVVTNVSGANGVVHAIDAVITPQSLVELVAKNGNLSSLTGALTAADLVSALDDEGPFTVFAPNNAAFTAAADTIAQIGADSLTQVLTYHVVAGANVRSDMLPDSAVTLQGSQLYFNPVETDGPVVIQNDFDSLRQEVPFITNDIQGTNGVIHTIGSILLPKEIN